VSEVQRDAYGSRSREIIPAFVIADGMHVTGGGHVGRQQRAAGAIVFVRLLAFA
jgi:hypothetical protein